MSVGCAGLAVAAAAGVVAEAAAAAGVVAGVAWYPAAAASNIRRTKVGGDARVGTSEQANTRTPHTTCSLYKAAETASWLRSGREHAGAAAVCT